MNWKETVALICWMVLAALNIVSLFVSCKFLVWTNVVFACFNFSIVAAVIEYFIKRKNGQSSL